MLDTSKGKIRSCPNRTIYEYHPGFDLRCHTLRSRLVVAEDHCPKAKRRIVCNPYRLCLVADSEHQEDRAEEFLLIGRIVGIDVSQYRWLEIEAGLIQLLPAVNEGRSSLDRIPKIRVFERDKRITSAQFHR